MGDFMTEKKNAIEAMDPLLRAALNIETDEPSTGMSGTSEPMPDILERLDNLQQFGVDVPRVVPTPVKKSSPLSLEQTKESLKNMADQLGDARRKKVFEQFFPKMLASSNELYGEDCLTSRFLRCAIEKDKAGMREVVKLLDAPFVPEPEIKSSEENENE
jgi:hypothetical protein